MTRRPLALALTSTFLLLAFFGSGFLSSVRSAFPESWDFSGAEPCMDSKMGHHFSSTEFGSCWYFSKSSSTSHSLPANSSGMRCCG